MTALIYPTTNLTQVEQLNIVRGDGIYVYDKEGKQYLEGLSALWCAALGYGNEEMIEAITQQLRTLPYSHMFGGRTHQVAMNLADQLSEMVPVNEAKMFFANSGSEANDSQIKMLRYYFNVTGKPQKKKIIALNDYDFSNSKRVIFLDNVVDPRNIGAIIRTCAAFNCKTIITTNKFEQLDEGIIAKASSGGLEYIDIITSNNLSNCLNELKKNKYWLIGFDSEANSNIEDSVFNLQDRIVLIFGEEGKGMRNLTKKLCDMTYRVNTIGEIKSLNVSVAIGIILDKITPNSG